MYVAKRDYQQVSRKFCYYLIGRFDTLDILLLSDRDRFALLIELGKHQSFDARSDGSAKIGAT